MSSDGIEYGWGSPAPRECKEVCEGRRLAKKREVWRRNTYCDACLGSVPMGADLFFLGAYSKRQTAWAAMPSPEPVKPSFSSVVALTLI